MRRFDARRPSEASPRGLAHLAWIPAAAAVGFGLSFVGGDRDALPVDLYYLLYFSAVLGFLWLYARRTALGSTELGNLARRHLGPALVIGALGGLVLMRGVLMRPATDRLHGAELAWALVWRGLIYGSVDGFLLLAFPWLVTWRAFGVTGRGLRVKVRAGVTAWVAILAVTTAYHVGYADFRSRRIVQPNIGSSIGAVPTLVSANPIASPLSHVFLHVAAVLHCPDTDLFLPPHRD